MIIPNQLQVTAQDAYNYVSSKVFADQQLCAVLKFDGETNEEALAKAIRLTLDLEPVLGCRFNENNGNPFWERRQDLDQTKLCTVIEHVQVEQALQAFINEPTHADSNPLVTAKIYGSPGGHTQTGSKPIIK